MAKDREHRRGSGVVVEVVKIFADLDQAEKHRDLQERYRKRGLGRHTSPYLVVELDGKESRYWVGSVGQLKLSKGVERVSNEAREKALKQLREPHPDLKEVAATLMISPLAKARLDLLSAKLGLQTLGETVVELVRERDRRQPVPSPLLRHLHLWKPASEGYNRRLKAPTHNDAGERAHLHVLIPACVRVEFQRLQLELGMSSMGIVVEALLEETSLGGDRSSGGPHG